MTSTPPTAAAPRVPIPALVAAIVLLLLGGVVGVATIEPKPDAAVADAPAGLRPVLISADKTVAASSARVSVDLGTTSVGSSREPTRLLEGLVDLDSGRGTLLLTAGTGTIKLVNDGTTTYVQFPPGWGTVPPDKWAAVPNDLPALRARGGGSPFAAANGSALGAKGAPGNVLHLLKQEGLALDAVQTGRADVRGVATTVHRVMVDSRQFMAWAFGNQPAVSPQLAEPEIEVFIGDDGLVRRQVLRIALGQIDFAMTATVEYWDFGTPLDLKPPPPGQTVPVRTADELDRLLRVGE